MRDLMTALGLRIKRGEQYHAEVVRLHFELLALFRRHPYSKIIATRRV